MAQVNSNNQMNSRANVIWPEIFKQSAYFKQAILVSLFINILMLTPTWYMLEVYDRVVNSKNHLTLLMLTILVLLLYAVLEVLEYVRSGILQKAADLFAKSIVERVFDTTFRAKLKMIPSGSTQAISDLRSIQSAMSSQVLKGLIDVPFALIALILIFAINPIMGYAALAGAIILSLLALSNHYQVLPKLADANKFAIEEHRYANEVIRNAQVIESMGMLNKIHQKWLDKHHKFLHNQALASDKAGVNAAISKLFQTMQGSVLLGIGCWLVLEGLLPEGGSMMIVGSILGGRVLTPFVTILTQWRTLANAHDSLKRLDEFLAMFRDSQETMQLPPQTGNISVEGVVAMAPNSQQPIIRGVNFRIPAGSALAIIGPSASGKTSLARLLTGIWPPVSGKVRLDGVDVFAWDKQQLGPYIGYLPQNVELFEGSIAENIARFGDVDLDKVKQAVAVVGLAEFIENLPAKYDTQIGDEGAFLSGGQRQRIGLARAIYGNPKLVVLDEPNSSLDESGDHALNQTMKFLKSQKTTLIVISHRTQIIGLMDFMLVLVDGQMSAFGPRDEVLKTMEKANQKNMTPVGQYQHG